MSNTLDLNAKRRARAAARREPMQLLVNDQLFDLVYEMPIELADLANNNDVSGALRLLLAHPDQDWDRLRACKPSYQDVMDVVEFFGQALGESLPSAGSSTPTGGRSKPTGNGSITGISPTTSTAATTATTATWADPTDLTSGPLPA